MDAGDIKKLETPNLILAKAVFEDWEELYRNLWSREESARYMLWTPTKTEEEAKERMRRTLQWQGEHLAYTVYEKRSGQAIGFAGMIEEEPGVYAESGIAVGPEFVGRGYGRQILNALVHCAFGPLKGTRFLAGCRSQNAASRRMILACGFSYVGSEERVDPKTGEPYTLENYEQESILRMRRNDMNKEIIIVLPNIIPVLRDGIDQPLKKNVQEFNIYFKNIILPYKEEYDIQVRCAYGRNHGTFYRLSEFPHDVDSFDFELVIYDEYGERIASKQSKIELYDRRDIDAPYNMIFVGDSMTFGQVYMEQIASNLHNIVFKGSRDLFGHLAHEGRGGWSYPCYFNFYKDEFGGASPFLFPAGVENYRGNLDFINNVNAYPHGEYNYDGYAKQAFQEGCVYGRDEKLYRYENGEFKLCAEAPKWEFDFGKYISRYQIGNVDAVSVLMGANDLQHTAYEESAEAIAEYIRSTEAFIQAVHRYDKNINIIINLPIIGAEQYCWGTQLGCRGSSKMYRYNIIHASKALLDKWDGCEDQHIYISPMLLCIDPENGFPKDYRKANRHSEEMEKHHSNWVHPNRSGYCQMGDAMCGVIQKSRNDKLLG